jgi:hypothetical protein
MKSTKHLSLIVAVILLFQSLACGQFPSQVGVHLPTPSETPDAALTASIPTASLYPTLTSSPLPSITATISISTPALSPSLASLRIAFTYDKKIWLWQNGIAEPLTGIEEYTHTPVRISDDGEIIAFARDGLWLINSDGSQERR